MSRQRFLPVLIFYSILVISITGFGQHYNIKNYSIEDGLAQSQVDAIYQDSKGYLWIGTLGGGVSRFDGQTFTNYTTRHGLTDNHVFTIFEDADGTMWFGTQQGVCRCDGTKFQRPDTMDGLGRQAVKAILEDSRGSLWFGSEKGAWHYDQKYKRLRPFTGKEGLTNNAISSMLLDSRGILWFGSHGGGIIRYDGRDFSPLSTVHGLALDTVHSILEDRHRHLWFATPGGVSRYDGKAFRNYTVKEGLSGNDVRAIIEDREGNLWFGTDGGGVCRFDGKVFTCLTEKNGLSSNVIWSLLEDREGSIWIGTYRGGLDQYRGGTFSYFSARDGLGDDVIRAILEDRAGNFWFGTYRGGVSRWDGKSITTFTTREGLIDNFVLTMFEDRQGDLWFGTFAGVSRYDGQTFMNLGREDGLADQIVRAIVQERSGHMWFGTNDGGISHYDGHTITNFTTADGLNCNQITALLEDRQGHIWIGTLNGLCCYDGHTFTNISQKYGLAQKNIYAITEDGSGSLWIGAYGDGIIKYTPRHPNGAIDVFSRADGLPHDSVVSLCPDNRGNLWLGTEKGISRFDAAAYERTGQKIFKHYGPAEGFACIECIHNAILKDHDGNIWFGTLKGAIQYHPHLDRPNLHEPITHITKVRLLFDEHSLSDYAEGISLENGLPIGLRLPYYKNHLAFDFIGISLRVPEKVKYRYQLARFDNLWLPVVKGSQATYSNIPPGKYTFKVKASNNDGVWNKEPTSFSFEITPPFWLAWWFYLLCAVVLIVGILTFIKQRTGNLEKQRKVLEEKVQLSTRDLQREKEKLEQRVLERTAELRGSEEKFRAVVENADDAIFILQDGVIKFPNPRTGEMLGYSSGELAEIPFERFIHPENIDRTPARQIKNPGADKGPITYPLKVINRDNKELWAELDAVPIHWDGQPATLIFLRDITEKKRLEAQLLQAQKMEAIGTMAGGIAHNFNNLLTGILGNASLILSEIEPPHPYYEGLKHIEQNVQNGVHLTRQLLGFARRGKYEVTTCDPNQIVRKSAEMFGRTRKEIVFHGKYEPHLRPVEADQGQIEQALLNLYVNAWQAMPGGGDIYIQTKNLDLDKDDAATHGLTAGHYVKISITDSGMGMDEATRQRIFEPFFTTKEMGQGTGLGLASVYGIITNHGGCIRVYSEKGTGTTFNIYLRASEKELVKEKKLPALSEEYLMGTETILVVDDEETVLNVGEKLLKRLGYRALSARSGQEALETYEKSNEGIHLVILDMIMPGLGGGETYKRLKKIDPHIKVLLSSGYSLNGQASQIMEQGCSGFIQKPFNLRELSQKIRSILDQ